MLFDDGAALTFISQQLMFYDKLSTCSKKLFGRPRKSSAYGLVNVIKLINNLRTFLKETCRPPEDTSLQVKSTQFTRTYFKYLHYLITFKSYTMWLSKI